MSPSVRQFHHRVFLKWIKDGKNTSEEHYTVKKVYPVTKRGFLKPCFKFYKCFLRTSGEIEYIAMFKRNKQDEMVVLVNSSFEIEAVTISLAQKLKLN